MQAIHTENVSWESQSNGVRQAELFAQTHGSEQVRIDLVEVPPGGYIPAHKHTKRQEFFTILLSAGAQIQLGERIFRPTAGQVFQREPGDTLALTNDTPHPFRYTVTRFGYTADDIEWLTQPESSSATS